MSLPIKLSNNSPLIKKYIITLGRMNQKTPVFKKNKYIITLGKINQKTSVLENELVYHNLWKNQPENSSFG